MPLNFCVFVEKPLLKTTRSLVVSKGSNLLKTLMIKWPKWGIRGTNWNSQAGIGPAPAYAWSVFNLDHDHEGNLCKFWVVSLVNVYHIQAWWWIRTNTVLIRVHLGMTPTYNLTGYICAATFMWKMRGKVGHFFVVKVFHHFGPTTFLRRKSQKRSHFFLFSFFMIIQKCISNGGGREFFSMKK